MSTIIFITKTKCMIMTSNVKTRSFLFLPSCFLSFSLSFLFSFFLSLFLSLFLSFLFYLFIYLFLSFLSSFSLSFFISFLFSLSLSYLLAFFLICFLSFFLSFLFSFLFSFFLSFFSFVKVCNLTNLFHSSYFILFYLGTRTFDSTPRIRTHEFYLITTIIRVDRNGFIHQQNI